MSLCLAKSCRYHIQPPLKILAPPSTVDDSRNPTFCPPRPSYHTFPPLSPMKACFFFADPFLGDGVAPACPCIATLPFPVTRSRGCLGCAPLRGLRRCRNTGFLLHPGVRRGGLRQIIFPVGLNCSVVAVFRTCRRFAFVPFCCCLSSSEKSKNVSSPPLGALGSPNVSFFTVHCHEAVQGSSVFSLPAPQFVRRVFLPGFWRPPWLLVRFVCCQFGRSRLPSSDSPPPSTRCF